MSITFSKENEMSVHVRHAAVYTQGSQRVLLLTPRQSVAHTTPMSMTFSKESEMGVPARHAAV